MVGSRPPPPESDMVSASMRHESKTVDILLGLPVKPSCVSMLHAAAVNNGRHSMVGSRPPPDMAVQGKACQVVSVVLIIVLGFALYPACTTAIGCYGHCGGYAGGCYCDNLCTTYGDCCADYLDVCSKSISHV